MDVTSADHVDVAVLGGGPAGATAAALVAEAGRRVKLFERESFPRFHIGESLMPETYWTFQRLGLLDRLKASAFQKKISVQFVNDAGKQSQPFFFDHHNPHESSQTWQVVRGEFDQMLLDRAVECGAAVEQGAHVVDVLFDGDRACGVRYRDAAGATRETTAEVVVDATGLRSLLAEKLNLRVADDRLRKGAVWTYYRGARRDVGRNEGATLVLSTAGKRGWFWYIPLHDDVVSIGVVSDFERLFDGRDHEQIFADELAACPAAAERLEGAERIDRFRATKEFSYHTKQLAGDGWVLVGDALGFLDPIYSSGVFLALKSGQLAADAIVAGLADGDVRGERLGDWAPEFLQGVARMKQLVYAFYDGFSFGAFIRRHPEFQGRLVDMLVGKLFSDEVDEMLVALDAMRREMLAAG